MKRIEKEMVDWYKRFYLRLSKSMIPLLAFYHNNNFVDTI